MSKAASITDIAILGGLILVCATHPISPASASDAQVTTAVEAGLRQHAELNGPNSVRVQTVNGTVYLYGHVDNEFQHQAALTVAKSAPGSIGIVDAVSTSDDDPPAADSDDN